MGGGKRRSKSRRGKRKRDGSNQSPEAAASAPTGTQINEDAEVTTSPNPKRRRHDESAAASAAPKSTRKPASFLEKMRMRLSGGHFRMLNEKLYTCSGKEAFDLFKNDPELFNVEFREKLHQWLLRLLSHSIAFPFLTHFPEISHLTGYQEQMSRWPEQPVNIIIKWLKSRNSSLVVADFGCGSANLAKNVKNKVYSMDLVANDPSVIACDMSHTPLDSASVDVAVFCLSLMGTNFPNYLQEANRVLKPCGWLLVAEVRSRFDPNNGGADPEKFCEAVKHLSFTLVSKDFTNKMFVIFYFKKKEHTSKVKNIEWPELKPCLYKRR